MRLASNLRNAYTFEQADSLEGLIIDDAVNQAVVESFESLEHGQAIPRSLREYRSLVVMRNIIGQYIAKTEASGGYQHGFTDAITVSATGLARVAALPQYGELSEAVDTIYSGAKTKAERKRIEGALHDAAMSVATQQVTPEGADTMYLDWSSQFPLLDRIRNGADQVPAWQTGTEYIDGYAGGLYFWPASVGAYALGEELREQFGDI